MTYTAEELEAMPTISQGWTDDLKIDTGNMRVWLSRLGVEDGEDFPNAVTVERFDGDRWDTTEHYAG